MSTEFFDAITTGNAARVREMLADDPGLAEDRTDGGTSALLTALYHRQREIADIILAVGPKLDIFDASAIGRTDRIAELIEDEPTRAKAHAHDGFFPLGLAAFFGQFEACAMLLARGADPDQAAGNAMKVTALHAAAAAKRADIVKLVLDAGGDANARQQMGYVPLHEAARAGDMEMAKALVEAGADIAAVADDGNTPQSLAESAGQSEMAEYLSRPPK